MRTAEGLGIHKVYLTGYTPYPMTDHDARLPHLAQKIHKQIQKTALGAETAQDWVHYEYINHAIEQVKALGYTVAAVEQADNAEPLPDWHPPQKIALLVGREVEGIESEVLGMCDRIVEIPMFGTKESFNVVQAGAMALYHCRFR